MAVKIRIPTPLRKITKDRAEVEGIGVCVGEILINLEQEYPGIKERLFDENGNLRRFVNIYLNNEDIRFLDNLATPVKDGDEISIVPAIAGGAKVVKKRLYLTYPPPLIKEPIIYQVGKIFEVVTNIGSATVSDEMGLVALEVEGTETEIEKAVKFLLDKGIKVEPIELDVIE